MKKAFLHSFELGDIVVERNTGNGKKRVGEIVYVTEGKRPKLKLLELMPRSLSPKFNGDFSRLKYFSSPQEKCRKLKVLGLQKRKIFHLGNVIRIRRYGTFKFGIIFGFHNPYDLYSDSCENGYNGKDTIECVEISGRPGLLDIQDPNGRVKRFCTGPEHLKICEILPMNHNGGMRIKIIGISPSRMVSTCLAVHTANSQLMHIFTIH